MSDILTAILYHEDLDLRGVRPLEQPLSTAETQFLKHLQTVNGETARLLRMEVAVLLQERHDLAFRSGACFGAQLVRELLEGF